MDMETETAQVKVIAHIRSDFSTKFGIPRQSGLVQELQGKIVFEPEFRSPEAVRGLDAFSHIWLLWQFSKAHKARWSPTVRPPRLGGDKRVGVFATRSPFRPNDIGLSSVRLQRVEIDSHDGPVLYVSGADLVDGTPIYDIKPYLPYVDCHPDATEGYTGQTRLHQLQVEFPAELLARYPQDKQAAIVHVLEQDPRPAYINDPERIYGLSFAGYDVKFKVEGDRLIVCDVVKL